MVKDYLKNKALVTLVIGVFLLVGYFVMSGSGIGGADKCVAAQNQAREAGLEVKRKFAKGDDDIDFAKLSRLRAKLDKECAGVRSKKTSDRSKKSQNMDKLPTSPLLIETQSGKKLLTVENALSSEDQTKGLMFRKKMGDDEGMLFVYPDVREITMWMKNTHLALDMVFISEKGLVSHIAYSTVPFSLETISSGGEARAVLEIKAGMADKLGLKIGDKVKHSAFVNE